MADDTLLVFVVVALVLRWIQRSTAGIALACVRNSPTRARTLGIDVARYRVASCAVGDGKGRIGASAARTTQRRINERPITAVRERNSLVQARRGAAAVRTASGTALGSTDDMGYLTRMRGLSSM